jgi:hypothetical protein
VWLRLADRMGRRGSNFAGRQNFKSVLAAILG